MGQIPRSTERISSFMKFCRREYFSEKFQENFMKFKKISLRKINRKRYNLQIKACEVSIKLNIMSI